MAVIDIYSKGEYPGSELSNFSRHPFWFRGVRVESMEGLLQRLKCRCPKEQKKVCGLSGKMAKRAGSHRIGWRLLRRVWWQGHAYSLWGDDLHRLIDEAYLALYQQSAAFRQALAKTGDARLVHSIGKRNAAQTILTEYHFCRRLEVLRTLTKGENV